MRSGSVSAWGLAWGLAWGSASLWASASAWASVSAGASASAWASRSAVAEALLRCPAAAPGSSPRGRWRRDSRRRAASRHGRLDGRRRQIGRTDHEDTTRLGCGPASAGRRLVSDAPPGFRHVQLRRPAVGPAREQRVGRAQTCGATPSASCCISSSWSSVSSSGRWLRATNSTGTPAWLRIASSASTSSSGVPA